MRKPSALVLYLLAGLLIGLVRADCYSHNGVLALNSKFYNEDYELASCGNGTNNCCFEGDKCRSNLLCFNPDGLTTRQYCADKNWDVCSMMCPGTKASGTLLVDCGRNIYCCGSVGKECCDTDGEHFFVDPETGDVKDPSVASAKASPTWWRVDSSALLAATSTVSSSASSESTTTAASEEVFNSAFTTTTESTSSSTTASPTNTPVNTPTNTASTEEANSSALSAGAGAGIGIEAAAGLALVGILIWWLLRRRKVQKAPAYEYTRAELGGHSQETKPEFAGDYYAHNGDTGARAPVATLPQELDATSPHTRQELAPNTRQELPASPKNT